MTKNYYPWPRLRPGEGFFIPTLQLAAVREQGLRASVPHSRGKRFDAYPAIKDGLIGVWFWRPPRGSSRPS